MNPLLDDLRAEAVKRIARDDIIKAAKYNYGFVPTDKIQAEILQSIRRYENTAVYSAHGIGKTATIAVGALDFMDQHNPTVSGEEGVQVVTTAPTWRQVDDMIWKEIRKWWNPNLYPDWEILPSTPRIKTPWPDTYALGFSTKEMDKFEGWHSPNLMIIVDEAKGISEDIFDAILGALTTDNIRLVYTSTPGNPEGTFYKACKKVGTRFNVIHANAFESKNVNPRYPEIVLDQCDGDKEHPIYIRKVLGEFVRMVERPAFNPEQVQDGFNRYQELEPEGYHTVGIDWARQKDWTVVLEMVGPVILPNILVTQQDYMVTCDYIFKRHQAFPFDFGLADLGEGVGQVARLHEMGMRMIEGERMSNKFKVDAHSKIKMRLQAGTIAFPDFVSHDLPEWGLKTQLMNFQESETPTGLKHLEGDVDDMVDALMLCVEAQERASRTKIARGLRIPKGKNRNRGNKRNKRNVRNPRYNFEVMM